MNFQNKYTNKEKEEYLDEYRNSNLSLGEYTRQKNIPSSTFRGWLAKETEIRFGEINVGEDNLKIPSAKISTVFITDKIRIELKEGYDKTLLKNIMGVLMKDDNWFITKYR